MIELTPQQIASIHVRITATCTTIRINRTDAARLRSVDVDYFDRQRLIESVRVQPGGKVSVLP